jgi:hypothetical protein
VRSPGFSRYAAGGDQPHEFYERWNQRVTDTQKWLWDVLLAPIDVHLRNKARPRWRA